MSSNAGFTTTKQLDECLSACFNQARLNRWPLLWLSVRRWRPRSPCVPLCVVDSGRLLRFPGHCLFVSITRVYQTRVSQKDDITYTVDFSTFVLAKTSVRTPWRVFISYISKKYLWSKVSHSKKILNFESRSNGWLVHWCHSLMLICV